jgi:hypothetical protein
MATVKRKSLQERLAKYPDWETALRAARAVATPTTSQEPTGSGAPTVVAAQTQSVSSDSGKTPTKPTLARIKDGQGSVALLRQWAREYEDEMPARDFVRLAYEEPQPPRLRAPREYRNNGHFDGRLEFWGVMAIANEWDSEGWTTPSDFVEAFACEVNGHPKGDAVSNIMRIMSAESRFDLSENDDEDDEYGKWRYGLPG